MVLIQGVAIVFECNSSKAACMHACREHMHKNSATQELETAAHSASISSAPSVDSTNKLKKRKGRINYKHDLFLSK